MDIGLISVRYALALLKGAQETNNETEVYNCMQSLFNAFLEVKPLRAEESIALNGISK